MIATNPTHQISNLFSIELEAQTWGQLTSMVEALTQTGAFANGRVERATYATDRPAVTVFLNRSPVLH